MPITKEQACVAKERQHRAARDTSPQVRLAAGPGTGKSHVICERVQWLLDEGVARNKIFVVSFTNASARDLRERLSQYLGDSDSPRTDAISVSTLHSLALRILKKEGKLNQYPVPPTVLSQWESGHIIDAEFSVCCGKTLPRSREIRKQYEAFWSTKQWRPPNYRPPDLPVTEGERAAFKSFHEMRTQCYACVLPGEIVRQCVTAAAKGFLDLVSSLSIAHLIVDEFQDLNPMDIDFVRYIAEGGAHVFIAGDDDQSIYSFRHAYPEGFQSFPETFASCGDHVLKHCFRCPPAILSAADALISVHSLPSRIPKELVSLPGTATPPVFGVSHLWQFKSEQAEEKAIASSCRDLITAGVPPSEILILAPERDPVLSKIAQRLRLSDVGVDEPKSDEFKDSDTYWFLVSVLRVACDKDDYVAHRLLLGTRRDVGAKTCDAIAATTATKNLNYRALFYEDTPAGLTSRQKRAIAATRKVCVEIDKWSRSDTVACRGERIRAILADGRGEGECRYWDSLLERIPGQMEIGDLREYLTIEKEEQREEHLRQVCDRAGVPMSEERVRTDRVRLMTMHGAKGLQASVVFVPGLEEETLPGDRRKPYAGLVAEAARLLYVSVTRAKIACVVSFARYRIVWGSFEKRTPSRFAANLGGVFEWRESGLSEAEIRSIRRERSLALGDGPAGEAGTGDVGVAGEIAEHGSESVE